MQRRPAGRIVRVWMVGFGAAVLAAIALAVLVIVLTSSDDTLVLDLEVGECFELALDDELSEIRTVTELECEDPHVAEVVAVGELDPDGDVPRPDDAVVFAQVDARCVAALDAALLERFGVLPVVADERSWEAFRGRYVCVAIPYGGEPTSGSALG